MKKAILVLTAFVTTLAGSPAHAENDKKSIYLRPFVGVGNTFFSNDVSETYGSAAGSDVDRINISATFGMQVLTDISPRLKVGLEASFQHFVNETTDNADHPLVAGEKEYCYHTLKSLALMEMDLSERFFVQAGSGLATAVKPYNHNTGTTPYFMIAGGVNIPLSEKNSIPVIIRMSSLDAGKGDFGAGHGFGSMVPVVIQTGVTLSF